MSMSSDAVGLLDGDVRQDLARVEEKLAGSVRAGEPFVGSATGHVLTSGGKRFRPMLVLLSGRVADPSGHADERVIDCAAAIELTHLATLYHDDVIDESMLRRGAPSANARFDNRVAILAGDWLFARSSTIAAELGTYCSRVLAETILTVCEGQIMEGEGAGSSGQTADRYFDVIRRKTAALVATSCHLGAWVAGAEQKVVEALTAYGDALGVAFQLSDDVLDISGLEEESGKVPGTDLREGVWTLPVLTTLAGEVPGGDRLGAALAAGDIDAALAALRGNGSVELALEESGRWGRRAKEALAPVPDGPARQALESLADFTARRTV